MGQVDAKAVGRRIRDRRLAEGYRTQKAAAAVAHVSGSLWNEMERGRRIPKTDRMQQSVAEALRWPPQMFDLLAAGIDPSEAARSANGLGEPLDRVAIELRAIRQRLVELSGQLETVEGSFRVMAGRQQTR